MSVEGVSIPQLLQLLKNNMNKLYFLCIVKNSYYSSLFKTEILLIFSNIINCGIY